MGKKIFSFIFLDIFAIFIFSACMPTVKHIVTNDNAYVINLDEVKLDHDFKLSNVFDSILIMPLDNSQVIIGKLNKVDIYEDRLIVLDAEYAKGIFVYNKKGDLLYKIGNVGFGPGEYASCTDFAIDHLLDVIYVYDNMGRCILVYDIKTGEYQRTMKIEQNNMFNRIWCNGGNLYAVTTYFQPKKDKKEPYYILKQLDATTGKVIEEWLDVETFNKGWKSEFLTTNLFYRLDEKQDLFAYGIADTIFCFNEKEFTPYMIFVGNKTIKCADISEEEKDISLNATERARMFMNVQRRLGLQQKKIVNISNIYENDGYMYFNYVTWPRFMVKYNMENGESSVYTNIKDDLLFLSYPLKYTITSFLTSDDNGVYYQVDTEMLSSLKSCLHDDVLSDKIKNKNVLNGITEDFNPIILYYEYKKK